MGEVEGGGRGGRGSRREMGEEEGGVRGEGGGTKR